MGACGCMVVCECVSVSGCIRVFVRCRCMHAKGHGAMMIERKSVGHENCGAVQLGAVRCIVTGRSSE